jgi:hypothetical protein
MAEPGKTSSRLWISVMMRSPVFGSLRSSRIADQPGAYRFVVLRIDAGLARRAGDADRDAVARRRAAVGRRLGPVEVGEVALADVRALFAFRHGLELDVALLGEIGVDANDLGRRREAVVEAKNTCTSGPAAVISRSMKVSSWRK